MGLASGVIRIHDIDMDVSNSNRQSIFGGPTKQIGKFETTTTYPNKKISETGRATIRHDGYKKDSTASKRLPTRRAMSIKCQQLSELGDAFSVNGLHVKLYTATYRLVVALNEDVAIRMDVVALVGVGNTND